MNLLELLREKEATHEQEDRKASITVKMAETFTPQADITAHELAVILKLFCMLSTDDHIGTGREMVKKHNLERHFTF